MKHLQTIIEDHSTAERICACCGMVLDEKITSDRGITILEHENKIHWSNTVQSHHDGAMGSVANTEDKKSFKINMWQNRCRIQDSRDSRSYANFKILQKIFDSKQVPTPIQNIVYHLSKKLTKQLLDMNARKDSFQKAIIYFAYEISGNKYLRKKFLQDFDVTNKKMFNKYVWLLKQEFHIVTDYAEYTEKLLLQHAMNLKFSRKETDLALSILKHAQKKGLTSSKNPTGIAGTALYISHCSLNKYKSNTLIEIAETCHVNVGTIQNIKRQWYEILYVLNLRYKVLEDALK